MGPNESLLEAAAAPTMERIRRDCEKAPVQIQPLLKYLEEHLFDPALDAKQLKLACGVRDNTLPLLFHHALGLPPYAYIEDCRLQVACRMLRDTDLKVWQIAQLIGYSTLQVFSRAFHRWSGLRPSVYRRKARNDAKGRLPVTTATMETTPPPPSDSGPPPPSSDPEPPPSDPLISWTTLKKAATGSLKREEADDLARLLARLYPDSFGSIKTLAI